MNGLKPEDWMPPPDNSERAYLGMALMCLLMLGVLLALGVIDTF